MTREEAINLIYQEIHDTKIQGEKYAFLKKSCDKKCEALDMAIKALEQRWIPVSERLPEIDTTNGYKASDVVLVCLTDRKRHMGFYCADTKWRFCDSGEAKRPFWEDVIAWMPLPEPYKAESEEV